MDYEMWLEKNEEDLQIECAESGADRELGFDFDRFCETRYDKYIKRQPPELKLRQPYIF